MDKDKLLKEINLIHKKGRVNLINAGFSNLEEVYLNNLSLWYHDKSDVRTRSKSGVSVEITNYVLKNPNDVILAKTYKGVLLEEKDFIDSEVECMEELLTTNLPYDTEKKTEKYIEFLIDKKNNVPASAPERDSIFTGRGMEIFEKYHSEYNLDKSNRIEFRVLFELMKKDNLLVKILKLRDYIDWLNSRYDYNLEELRTVDLKSKKNIVRKNNYNRIKQDAKSNL